MYPIFIKAFEETYFYLIIESYDNPQHTGYESFKGWSFVPNDWKRKRHANFHRREILADSIETYSPEKITRSIFDYYRSLNKKLDPNPQILNSKQALVAFL